jgi:hypothetical protein
VRFYRDKNKLVGAGTLPIPFFRADTGSGLLGNAIASPES